jgi:hypothetical protein
VNDGADIKKHPWFKGINWDEVYQRKLKPPLPEKKMPKLNNAINTKIEDNISNDDRNRIPDWSFIKPEGF